MLGMNIKHFQLKHHLVVQANATKHWPLKKWTPFSPGKVDVRRSCSKGRAAVDGGEHALSVIVSAGLSLARGFPGEKC